MSDKVRVLRLIEYDGAARWVRATLERSLPDGEHIHGLKVRTLGGNEYADLRLRHPEWDLPADYGKDKLASFRLLPLDLVEEIREALDAYSDVIDGGDGTDQPLPNKAMRALQDLERALGER